MTISEKINKDITDAMRARDEHRLTTLRMMKSGIRSRAVSEDALVGFQDYQGAWTVWPKETFDVVLLDLSLPDSQGLHTFDQAHQAAGRAPILVLTGLDL